MQKTFVTATTTRRKQQQEQMHRALLAEEDRRRAARENFHMTAVPIMQHAAYEPALHHASEEHEEGTPILTPPTHPTPPFYFLDEAIRRIDCAAN